MLNDNIRTLRKRMGLTQVELAERLNVSQSTITSWENGTRRPDLDLLPILAQIFGVTIDVLLGRDQIVTKEPWDVESAFSAPEDETIRIMARGMGRMTQENREKLLNVAKTLFAADFDEADK